MGDPKTPACPWSIETEGDDHEVRIGPGAQIEARVIVKGRGNQLIVGSNVVALPYAPAGFPATVPDAAPSLHSITIDGENNVVRLGSGTRLGVNMTIRGSGNTVEIGEACHLHGFMNVLCSNARLKIGDGVTMVQGSIQLHEPGEIVIGDDCMISSQVYISLSDIHPIYDRGTGQRINPAASVVIGDHVWAGLRCMIMKGARIGDGGVIAAGAIVSGQTPPNAIVAGVPGRVVRENIAWRRDFSQPAPEPMAQIQDRPRRWRMPWAAKRS